LETSATCATAARCRDYWTVARQFWTTLIGAPSASRSMFRRKRVPSRLGISLFRVLKTFGAHVEEKLRHAVLEDAILLRHVDRVELLLVAHEEQSSNPTIAAS
jgi:hypothetical protein